MTGAVGSLPALTRLYLGAKHAVCTWPGLRVWPGAREGWPALAPPVTKARPGPPPGLEHRELFMGWVLGAEWGQGRAGIGRGHTLDEGLSGRSRPVRSIHTRGEELWIRGARKAQSHLPAWSSPPALLLPPPSSAGRWAHRPRWSTSAVDGGPGRRWNLSEIGGQSGGIQSSTEESAFFSPALSLPTELRGQQPLAPLLRRRLGILVLPLTPPVIPARLFEPPVPPLGNGDNHTSLSGQS